MLWRCGACVCDVVVRCGVCGLLLDAKMQDFPSNPVFLSLFVESESRSQLSASLRRHFDAQLSPRVNEQEPSPGNQIADSLVLMLCGCVFSFVEL